MDAQRQRAVDWSDWLDVAGDNVTDVILRSIVLRKGSQLRKNRDGAEYGWPQSA